MPRLSDGRKCDKTQTKKLLDGTNQNVASLCRLLLELVISPGETINPTSALSIHPPRLALA